MTDKTFFDLKRYKHIFTADFETSTPEWGVDKARVWLWDFCDEKLNHTTGTDMTAFMVELSRNKYHKNAVGFRNLSFDGYYILSFLLEQGFDFVEQFTAQPYTFTSLITDNGLHYFYKICFGNGNFVMVFDTLKHFNQSIKNTADRYELPIKKGEIDYDRFRPVGYEPTETEIDYIHNDTEIDMRALLIDFEQGLTNITMTGNCKKRLKKITPDYKYLFPELSAHEDSFCRQAYRGGFTWLDKRYAVKDLGHMISLDINSMYPAQMLHAELPFGYPYEGKGDFRKSQFAGKYKLYIQHFTCMFELKKNGVPMISKRSFRISSNDLYLESSNGFTFNMWLSNPDLELFFANYNVFNIEYIDFMCFESKSGYEINDSELRKFGKRKAIEMDGSGSMFYDYILPYRLQKEFSTGAVRDNAKRMQNIVYGAFASSAKSTLYCPYLNEKGLLRYTPYEGEGRKTMYVPVSVFVTAWARNFLIKTIMSVRDRFVYCDTDSMYMLGSEIPENVKIHPSLYGYFKIEHDILKARFVGSKRYIYFGRDHGKSKINKIVTCCGATKEVKAKMNFSNFYPGAVFDGKLMGCTVPGGKHLVSTTYKLKV